MKFIIQLRKLILGDCSFEQLKMLECDYDKTNSYTAKFGLFQISFLLNK